MKIGRNDPCPCGSGKKYKKCCLNKERGAFMSPYHHTMSNIKFNRNGNTLSLYERNMTLVNGIIDIFSLNKEKDWTEIKKKISKDHIKELYKLIAWLWPPDTNIASLLPKPENKLRSLYLGFMHPESVLNSVVRYSLYCDQILVMNPFMNPWCVAEKYNPLVHPKEHIADTLKWILFIMRLAPWIQSQHIILIPDPGDFDYQLRKQTWELAEKRLQNFSKEDFVNDSELNKYSKEDFKRMWLSAPTQAMRQKLKEYDPKMSEKDIDEMMEYIEKLKDQDPYCPTNPNETGMSRLHTSQTGANLEMGLFLSQMTGSYLYTDFDLRWKEISSIANYENNRQEIWGPITQAFQKLDFKFLNKVDPIFANQIRQDGRLESMRNFLRKTQLSLSSDNKINQETILDFKDELVEEYNKAEVEWEKIDSDLIKWVTSEGGFGSILTAGMNWQIPALGFSIAAVGNLLSARFERKRFRKNVPLSVFVDLKNKKESL